MGTSPTKSTPSPSSPFYVWKVPGKPISIQFHFDVIDRMLPDAMRALGALKRRGAEVGGILLGKVEPGSPQTVSIVDFEPVRSEYLTGPSYSLSENDLVVLEAALARRQSETVGSELAVVGFYRSHTRDDLYMDDADLALAQRYFGAPGNVFLLIKPFAGRTSIGGFFIWEDGRIQRESSYLQFPFDRGELGGGQSRPDPARRPAELERSAPPYTPAPDGELARAGSAVERWPASTKPGLSIMQAAESAAPASTPRGWQWLLVPAFLAVAGIAGFFAYRDVGSSKTATRRTTAETGLPLKLSVAEKLNQLDVTWDRNAPAIVRARRGVLAISDGLNKRDLELSGAQLRTGRVLYSRLSGDVGLRLEVFPEGQETVSESIRIVSSEPPRQLPAAATPVEKPKAPASQPPSRIPERSTVRKSAPAAVEAPLPEQQPELQRPARRR